MRLQNAQLVHMLRACPVLDGTNRLKSTSQLRRARKNVLENWQSGARRKEIWCRCGSGRLGARGEDRLACASRRVV